MKRVIIGIICGLLTTEIIQWSIQGIIAIIAINAVRNLGPDEYDAFGKSLSAQTFYTFLSIFYLAGYLLGGITKAYITKKNGMKYGLVIGIILSSVPIILLLITIIFPQFFYGPLFTYPVIHNKVFLSLFKNIKSIPVTLALTVLGGYHGEKLSKLHKKHEQAI